MPQSLRIPARFNRPLESGNGGYCSGAIASFLPGPAEVSLRRPVPLDGDLEVRPDEESVEVFDGDALIAEGQPAPEFELAVPEPVSPDQARAATARYRGRREGEFSRCFVCGLDREDAFGVFAGTVDGSDLVASPWTPSAWAADPDGHALPKFVWAVLDCPTYFALHAHGELPASVLARLTARLDAPVPAEREHVVVAWPLESDGRKRHAEQRCSRPRARRWRSPARC